MKRLGLLAVQGVFCFQFDTEEGGSNAAAAFQVSCLLRVAYLPAPEACATFVAGQPWVGGRGTHC